MDFIDDLKRRGSAQDMTIILATADQGKALAGAYRYHVDDLGNHDYHRFLNRHGLAFGHRAGAATNWRCSFFDHKFTLCIFSTDANLHHLGRLRCRRGAGKADAGPDVAAGD